MPIYIANSRWVIAVASVLYLSVTTALLLTAWPAWISYSLMIPLVCDFKRVIRAYGTRRAKYAVAILRQDCDSWRYQLNSGKEYKAKLIKSRCYCSTLVLILYFSSKTSARYVVIPRDTISERNYRFLASQINY